MLDNHLGKIFNDHSCRPAAPTGQIWQHLEHGSQDDHRSCRDVSQTHKDPDIPMVSCRLVGNHLAAQLFDIKGIHEIFLINILLSA